VRLNAEIMGGSDIEHSDQIEIVPISGELLEQAAEVHLEAFHDRASGRLGRRYAVAFIRWFADRPDTVALAALVDGKVGGYLVGAPLGYQRDINRDLFWTVFVSTLVRPRIWFSFNFIRIVLGRLQVMIGSKQQSTLPELPRPTFCEVGIGVSTRARGRGVGVQMLKAFEAEGRRRGMKSIISSVYRENTAGRALFEKGGYSAMEKGAGATVKYCLILK